MQIDMHYHAVYCLARMAGLSPDTAHAIASASQYVDQSVLDDAASGYDGREYVEKRLRLIPANSLKPEPTAHHTTNFAANNDLDDQRQIWVPFHFLPGGEGDGFSERLVCSKNGRLAREMLAGYLEKSKSPFASELIGVAAHVYADTFSHYGFSGVSSRCNQVEGDSLRCTTGEAEDQITFADNLRDFLARFPEKNWKISNFMRRVLSNGAEVTTGALGHGPVATFPDKPYLRWEFRYEHPDVIGERADRDGSRNNAETFSEACRGLFYFFRDYAAKQPDLTTSSPVNFDDYADVIDGILRTRGRKSERAQVWRSALEEGQLTGTGESIPEYPGNEWDRQYEQFSVMDKPVSPDQLPVYRFYQAASYHRHYVLRELLPTAGIMVV